MDTSLLAILPMLLAVAAGVLVLLADAFAPRRVAVGVGIAGMLAATAVAGVNVVSAHEVSVAYGVFVGGGGFSIAVACILAFGAIALAGSWTSLSQRAGAGSAVALVAFASAAACGLAQSVDLVITLIALETVAVCAYGLVSGARTPASDEAAMKYLVQGAVSTGLIVLGSAILLGLYAAGTSYFAIADALSGAPLLPATAAASLVMASFAFKLGAFPFHSWAPDALETAPPSASAFLATAPKLGAIVGLFVIVATVFDGTLPKIGAEIAVIAALSIIIGNFGGLRQVSYTRMLGYSGIAQIGYALVGLAASAQTGAGASGQPSRVLQILPMVLVLVVAYGLAASGAFLGAGLVRRARPQWDGTISGMAGFGRAYPVIGTALAVCMFSLTGIPLTAGFWGKLLVFGAAFPLGWGWLAWVGIIGSVVSFGYYGSVLRSMFFDDAAPSGMEVPTEEPQLRLVGIESAVVLLLALTILAAGIIPLVSGVDSLVALFAG